MTIEIPNPTETGADGTQEPGAEIVSLKPHSPTEGLHIAKAVNGLAATKSKSLGGDVAARLLAGSFSQISYELHEAKQEVKSIQAKHDQVLEDLSECKQLAAVLKERVRSTAQNRHLKNLSITSGTALVGIAIEFMRNDLKNYAAITGGLGVLLILIGWFSGNREVTK